MGLADVDFWGAMFLARLKVLGFASLCRDADGPGVHHFLVGAVWLVRRIHTRGACIDPHRFRLACRPRENMNIGHDRLLSPHTWAETKLQHTYFGPASARLVQG